MRYNKWKEDNNPSDKPWLLDEIDLPLHNPDDVLNNSDEKSNTSDEIDEENEDFDVIEVPKGSDESDD